jgi:hypothetical protein
MRRATRAAQARRLPAVALLLASTLLALLAAPAADAADARRYRFTNRTGSTASDLHVTFAFTGGSLEGTVVVNAPGCPPPVVPSNGTVTNTLVVDWRRDCVRPGASVTVDVRTDNGPLDLVGGFWTDRAHQLPPGIGPLDPQEDVEELELGDGGKKIEQVFFCCQYLCLDSAARPYLVVTCGDVPCPRATGPGDACPLAASRKVLSCEECPPGVSSGEGGHACTPREEEHERPFVPSDG